MDRLFEYLTGLSGGAAYWIVFGVLVACGLGFPLPEDIPLIAAGYLTWEGTMQLGLALLTTLFGVLIGDSLLYFIGHKLGRAMLDHETFQTFFKPEKIRRTKAYFRKFGDKIVFFARFVAGFRAVAFFTAGAMHMKYTRFVLLDGLAALLSVPVWIAIGYYLGHFLGDEIEQILVQIRHLKNYATIGIFSVFAIVVIRIFIKYRRSQEKLHPDAK